MASNNTPPQTPTPAPNRRRSSIAGLLQQRVSTSPNANAATAAFPSAMSTAMQARQTNPRRMSLTTTLGLSGSPTAQTSPFGNYSRRRDSVSSSQDSGSPSHEEALLEENETHNPANTPVSPFARRVSFGAQAFGSVRSGGGSFSNAEGFNWGDSLREKSGKPPPNPLPNNTSTPLPTPPVQHQRAASVTTMEPPKQMPQPTHYAKPDILGERMLRGDFTMD